MRACGRYTRDEDGSWVPSVEFAERHPRLSLLRPLSHLVLGGGFGGQQMLCTKLLMGCLQTSVVHERALFATGYPYILVAVRRDGLQACNKPACACPTVPSPRLFLAARSRLCLCALFWQLLALAAYVQLSSLNKGLAAEGALIAVPIYNTAFMVFTMFTSVVFNQTFDRIAPHQSVMLLLGLCLVVSGLMLILWRAPGGVNEYQEGAETVPSRSSIVAEGDEVESSLSRISADVAEGMTLDPVDDPESAWVSYRDQAKSMLPWPLGRAQFSPKRLFAGDEP